MAHGQVVEREAFFCSDCNEIAGNPIEAARRSLALEFRKGGLDSPELDARLLMGHVLALDHAGLAAHAKRALLPEEAARVTALAKRRLGREPTARILGHKEFWGISFKVDRNTFLPRPETETVVEAALQALGAHRNCSRGLRIADLGTGAGILLVSLLSELGEAFGVGTDISAAAIDCARRNAIAQRVPAAFVNCAYGAALKGPIDLLVSNPPYIPRDTIATLEPEVRAFDPTIALDGGSDGLDGYRAIAADSQRLLAPDGVLVVEVGFGQAAPVRSIFVAAGLASPASLHDLSGVPRALVARRLP